MFCVSKSVARSTPKVIISEEGERQILGKKIELFFEFDKDINRAENIQKAYDYGYTQAEIANFLNLSPSAVSKHIHKEVQNGS